MRKVLEVSHLAQLFDAHESEEKAVAAFYGVGTRVAKPVRSGPGILCLDRNADVLAYLRELLLGAGYDVQTTTHPGDALMLMRVTHFDLVVLGPDLLPATRQGLHAVTGKVPVIELASEFCTLDAGEAASGLLQEIQSRINPSTLT